MSLYQRIVDDVPALKRGLVWCKKCGREQKVNAANRLAKGWPECHGETMTIDHPDTWAKP